MPKTDEDVLRELLHRVTDDLQAPPAVTAGIVARHHRRLRSTRILSIATTSVAAAAVVVTRVGPSAPGQAQHPAALPPVKLTAMQVLDQLSVAAAHSLQPAGRYVALTEIDLDPGATYPKNLLSELVNPKLPPSLKEQLQQTVTEYGYERTVIFDGVTGDVRAYQHGSSVPGSSVPSEAPVAKHWSPTRAEFAAWPTNPAKLRALLVSRAGQTVGLDINGVTLTADDLVFQAATSWLWNPLLSPALRSAMYKVLAATPGVTVKTGTTDPAGRPSRSAGTTASQARNPPSKARALAPCSSRNSTMAAPPCTRRSPATPPFPPTPTAAAEATTDVLAAVTRRARCPDRSRGQHLGFL
jgi:hypothetical protein